MSLKLVKRPRRLRMQRWSRVMVREHHLRPSDLIWPVFVTSGADEEPVASMPGVVRYPISALGDVAQRAADLRIPALALFPNTPKEARSDDGVEAFNPDNLICRAIRAIKQSGAEIGLICDVALDPYTTHGHDGLIDDKGIVMNDATVDALVGQALNQARAGADIIAPSDMMDGRIGAIRSALDAEGYAESVQIMSYAAKYASAFYGPFRDAVGSGDRLTGDKRTYQMDPGNSSEALREVALDIEEGADSLIVKPGGPYLDIIHRVKETFAMPVIAYQVSGEYAALRAAGERGWLDYDAAMLESLLSIRRAGADAIMTYAAPAVAEHLLG